MNPIRIVLALSGPPLPFGHATGRGLYVLLKGLVERGHRVTAFAPCREPEEATAAREWFPPERYDLRLFPYPRRRGVTAKWATLRRPFSYPFAPELRAGFVDVARECDIVHLEGTWTGWLGRGLDSSKMVINVVSLYEIDHPGGGPVTLLQRLHRTLQRRAERQVIRSYATLLTLTQRLADRLRDISPKSAIEVMPLGIDTALYPFIARDRRPLEPVIGLIGSMDWYPSYSAAVRLLTRLWPQIKEAHPNAKLRIVGWNARSALEGYLSLADVDILENVTRIRDYFEDTTVFVYAPLVGSGMKVKILEAFAFGVPVVTTSDGVEGLPVEDGVHAAIAETDDALVTRTLALLCARDLQEQQRLAARRLVESHCSPERVLTGLERCYAEILERRKPGR
jgi:glycosyltransferase involved in cell wall biosynthesis